MPQVRPFTFSNLPRLTAEQATLQRSLSAYLTQRPFRSDFATRVASMVESYLKVPCRVSPPELQAVTRAGLSALIPSTACIIVVGASPSEHKIIVEVDTNLVGFAIERLLGGTGETGRILRPLTDIEEGVFSFLALKILNFVHDGWERGRELALTLDRFASNVDEIADIVSAEAGYFLLGTNFSAGKRVGYLRVLIPNALLTENFRAPVPQANPTAEELDYMRSLFRSLPVTRVQGVVEGAYLDLGPSDLTELEKGDIIVLENHELSLRSGLVGGAATVRLGTGKNGGLRVRVFDDGDHNRLEILDIVVQEQPAETPMADDNPDMSVDDEGAVAAPDDNFAGTENLLRDVPAPVVVELGRISMSTAQVVRLRQGEILRLPRGANDPVDLTVNGKLFARGELIEVDGELGVRLLKVVGAPRSS